MQVGEGQYGKPWVSLSSILLADMCAINYRSNRMVGFNNIELITDRPLADNLKEIEEVKKYFPNHAVVASLMVETKEEWHQIIKDVQNAGADGLELKFRMPTWYVRTRDGLCSRTGNRRFDHHYPMGQRGGKSANYC